MLFAGKNHAFCRRVRVRDEAGLLKASQTTFSRIVEKGLLGGPLEAHERFQQPGRGYY
jgi:hypothetical protein